MRTALSTTDPAAQTSLSNPAGIATAPPTVPLTGTMPRPAVRGKFLFVGDEKLYLRGVTYGTFRPGPDGADYDAAAVERDFAQMSAAGINAVRVYTVPPRSLLDAAQRHGLRVMVGLPWEQHIAFLADRKRQRDIVRRVREGVRACAGHPALLCFAIGNEIPSSIVRWHGARRVERFLGRLVRAVKDEDPGALVTYVNFPSTEYLDLDAVDFVSFNVYLESRERLAAYLARLQNLAGDRPLVMAEIGLDSLRNGEVAQADTLAWQVDTIFTSGCAGAFVFSWTDEWHRGGHDIEDWDFGLVTRDRTPKPALAAVSEAYARAPFPDDLPWPRISVVVCSYNGARTIGDTLDGLSRVRYPEFEVIVVDDGSTDATAAIASEYDVRLLRLENGGLGAARNAGMRAATGEIVAYTDDDARPDPDWLRYLAWTYLTTDSVAVGGPNIAPAGDGWIADAVANAPGGPVHVLVSDTEADHIPGCNFTVRKAALEAIGGWDPRYRSAGDDVDCCWRLQAAGGRIGFNHAAMVWHHRRNSVKTYWKQQQGYGKAEALLEEKWPERYNPMGHLSWVGRLYGKGLTQTVRGRLGRVYQGTWGTALFQSVYEPAPGLLASLPLMPEWWLVVLALGALSLLGLWWTPLLAAVPVLLVAVLAPVIQAVISARRAEFTSEPPTRLDALELRALTAALHLVQPVARLRGRIRHGLTPWRRRGEPGWRLPARFQTSVWSEEWRAPEDWLGDVEAGIRKRGLVPIRGGDFDRWDLAVRGGLLGGARLLLGIEEHGAGRQMARFRVVPTVPALAIATTLMLIALALIAVLGNHPIVAAVLAIGAGFSIAWSIVDAGRAMSVAAAVDGGN